MKLTRSNPKAFATITNALKELSGLQGKVGWFESAKYENGTPVAYVMMLNEVGHGKTPPRPVMRPTAAENTKKWGETAVGAARQVVAGVLSGTGAMDIITTQAEGDVSKTIADLTSPALSPVTIELRAMKKRNPDLKITGATVGIAAQRVKQPGYVTPNVSTKPLVDSGLAISTLTHIVEKTG